MEAYIQWATHYVEDEETRWETEKAKADVASALAGIFTVDQIRDMIYQAPKLKNGWGSFLGNNAIDTDKTKEEVEAEMQEGIDGFGGGGGGESSTTPLKKKKPEASRGDLEKGSEKIAKK